MTVFWDILLCSLNEVDLLQWDSQFLPLCLKRFKYIALAHVQPVMNINWSHPWRTTTVSVSLTTSAAGKGPQSTVVTENILASAYSTSGNGNLLRTSLCGIWSPFICTIWNGSLTAELLSFVNGIQLVQKLLVVVYCTYTTQNPCHTKTCGMFLSQKLWFKPLYKVWSNLALL